MTRKQIVERRKEPDRRGNLGDLQGPPSPESAAEAHLDRMLDSLVPPPPSPALKGRVLALGDGQPVAVPGRPMGVTPRPSVWRRAVSLPVAMAAALSVVAVSGSLGPFVHDTEGTLVEFLPVPVSRAAEVWTIDLAADWGLDAPGTFADGRDDGVMLVGPIFPADDAAVDRRLAAIGVPLF